MRICHISYSDGPFGAGRSAYNLHAGLCDIGIDSVLFVKQKNYVDQSVVEFYPSNGFIAKNRRQIYQKIFQNELSKISNFSSNNKYEILSYHHQVYDSRDLIHQIPKADIYCLHWVSRFFDVRLLKFLTDSAPVFWRLSDMNPFTGGCHYSRGCLRFSNQCGKCPQIGSENKNDITRKSWIFSSQEFTNIAKQRFSWISQSRWIAECIKQHPIASNFPVHILRNGVDTSTFRPRNKDLLRDVLGLPVDAFLLLFVADSFSSTRKGWHLLLQVLAELKSIPALHLVCVGSEQDPVTQLNIPFTNFGRQNDTRWMGLIMNCADVFLFPSMEDNCPNTVLECMASGTPVVAWDIHGSCELIKNGETGLTARHFDVQDMAKSVVQIYENPKLRTDLTTSARKFIENYCTRNLQVNNFLNICQKTSST